MAEKYDLIIRNGRIIDGTGNPWFKADIGIVGEKIAAISRTGDGMNANMILDAAGMVVSPGFIDNHTHDDAYILIDPQCSQKVRQGVTTVVIGNCGFSLAPLSDAHCNDFKAASAIMGGNRLSDDFWFLRSFAQYLERLDADLVVLDPAAVIDKSTFEDPLQPPEGIRWVIVNGAVAAEDGKIAGATSGKVRRRGAN